MKDMRAMEVVLGFDVGGLVYLVHFGVYNTILNTPFSPCCDVNRASARSPRFLLPFCHRPPQTVRLHVRKGASEAAAVLPRSAR